MTFEDPIWLYLTPVLVLATAGLLALGFRQRNRLLTRFAAARLLEQLTERASLRRSLAKAGLVVLAVGAICLALARPQYGVEWSQQKARGIDIVFALDSSKSMLATDLRPTRLERAKLAILDLVARLESDRIGLVAFAGQAFLQTPPTLDYAAFRESLDATDPSMLSRGGSDLGRALEETAEAFPGDNNVKVVLLLTDGEDLGGRALETAKQAAEDGIRVFAIGVGTPKGEYLRIRNEDGIEEFIRDREGQPVRSQLEEATLRQIAELTGGRYTRLSDGALNQLYDSVLATLPREERESELKEVKIERFQWLLAAAICCLIAESIIRRRGSGRSAALLLLLAALGDNSPIDSQTDSAAPALMPAGVHLLATAGAEAEPAVAPEALAYEAMQNGDYAKALEHYETAIRETTDRRRQRDTLYNMGQAQHQIARQTYENGDLEQALEEMQRAEDYFKSATEVDPDDNTSLEDAEKTSRIREQLEELLKQQEKQQKQQEQQQQGENQEDSQQEQDSRQSEGQSDGQQGQDGADTPESEDGSQEESPSSEDGSGQKNQSSGQSENGEQSDAGQENQPAPSEDDSGSQDSASQSGEDSEDDSADQASSGSESGDNEQEDASEQQNRAQEDVADGETPPSEGDAEEQAERHSGEAPEPTDEASEAVPEVPGDEADGEPDGEKAPGATTGPGTPGGESREIRGMTVEQAQDLLDSLRGNEEILPFTQPQPGEGRPLKDW